MQITVEGPARVAKPEWKRMLNEARTDVLISRSNTSNVGETRVPFETAWWQNICQQLLARIEDLEAAVENLKSDKAKVRSEEEEQAAFVNAADLIKRGPGRPAKS